MLRFDVRSGEWASDSPVVGPTARNGAAQAWDAVRREFWVAGGSLDTDIWRWSAAAGQWSSIPTVPAQVFARESVATFDTVRDRFVLLGFHSAPTQSFALAELARDGGPWVVPNSQPLGSRLRGAGITYDSSTRRVVLFGGSISAGVFLNETWEWDGAQFERKMPTVSPPPRVSARLAYDSTRRVDYLWGGRGTLDGGGYVALNDVWAWDGANWSDVSVPERQPGITRPPPMLNAEMSEGPDGGLYLLGPGDGSEYPPSQLWYINDKGVFVLVAPSVPTGVFGHMMASEPGGRRVYVTGGKRGESVSREVYVYNGVTWARLPMFPAAAASDGCMVYDSARVRLVRFGGGGEFGSGGGDMGADSRLFTLALDGGTAWVEHQNMAGAPWPSPRAGSVCFFDASRGALVVFGGGQGAVVNNELWEWRADGSWVQVDRTGSWPAPRRRAGGAFDPRSNQFIVHGGVGQGQVFDDVWAYSTDGGFTSLTPRRKPAYGWPAPAEYPSLGWHGGLGQILRYGDGRGVPDDGLWALGREEFAKPGLSAVFRLDQMSLGGAEVRSAVIRLRAGATGPGGGPSFGVFVNREETLVRVASGSGSLTSPVTVTTTFDGGTLSGFLGGEAGEASVVVAPDEGGTVQSPSKIRVEAVELTFSGLRR